MSTAPMQLSREDIMTAVSDGVRQAILDIATRATAVPCADFYDSISLGVETALSRMADYGDAAALIADGALKRRGPPQ